MSEKIRNSESGEIDKIEGMSSGIRNAILTLLILGAIAGVAYWTRGKLKEHRTQKLRELIVEQLRSEEVEYSIREIKEAKKSMASDRADKYSFKDTFRPIEHDIRIMGLAGLESSTFFDDVKLTEMEEQDALPSSIAFKRQRYSDVSYSLENDLYLMPIGTGGPNSEKSFRYCKGALPSISNEGCRVNINLMVIRPHRDGEGKITEVELIPLFRGEFDEEARILDCIVLKHKPGPIRDEELIIALQNYEQEAEEWTRFRNRQVALYEDEAEKDPETLAESADFNEKLKRGMVEIGSIDSDGRRSSCTGVVYDERTIVTAKHCLKHDSGNTKMIEDIRYIDDTGDSTKYKTKGGVEPPGPSGYRVSISEEYDWGIIRFNEPIIKDRMSLGFGPDHSLREGRIYFMGHKVGNGDPKWKTDYGTLDGIVDAKHMRRDDWLHDAPYRLLAGCQGGNSGTPIIDSNGIVVGILAKSSTWFAPVTDDDIKKHIALIDEKQKAQEAR